MRVLAGSLLAPCWMLLYSVAAMLAITGPCYTVMFQLSPTWLRLLSWQLLMGVLSKITFRLLHGFRLPLQAPPLLLAAQATGYTSWLCLLAALPAFLWLHCCIAASLHRCTCCHFLSMPL
ncbi:hypothetical protein V8C86DRAFT_2867503, partial [Haematococcus lacustris]